MALLRIMRRESAGMPVYKKTSAKGGKDCMIGRSDKEPWDKYAEYAKEHEQMENERREIAEAADAHMDEFMEELRSDEELVELLEGLEEGTMVQIILE